MPTGAAYPGDAKVRAVVLRRCGTLFINYVGLEAEGSGYGVGFNYPTESDWAELDRQPIVCFALSGAEVTGSAHGLGTESVAVVPRQAGHAAGAESADGRWVALPDLKVGECARDLRSHAADLDAVIEVVACTRPHDDEIFAVFRLHRGHYPGENTTAALATRGCRHHLAGYVGTTKAGSTLNTYNTHPSLYDWPELHTVVCAVESPTAVTGSARTNR